MFDQDYSFGEGIQNEQKVCIKYKTILFRLIFVDSDSKENFEQTMVPKRAQFPLLSR
jgi:hypothetical protein